MVIPSYWGRKKSEGMRDTDSVYDHPTPLDERGTLARALKSLSILDNKDFTLVVLGISTASDIRENVESKILSIIKEAAPDVQTILFSYTRLTKIHSYLTKSGQETFIPLLKLEGYSNIRNLCLFSAYLLGSDVAVLIDDDEIFEDSQFMAKALQFIGTKIEGNDLLAVAGYYINPDNNYLLHKEIKPWMTYWNKVDCMNRAFKKTIGKGPRLKETSFVFGGNMVVHRDLFSRVPFDPSITRGEDIDFLINARMFGHTFYLDNQLTIKHDAPPKPHPEWRKLREDILRFVFEKSKLEAQKPVENMARVTAENLGIYPGEFLKEDLEDRIFRSNLMLAADYLTKGDQQGATECLHNIYLGKARSGSESDPFQGLLKLQKTWEELMKYFSSEKVKREVCSLCSFSLD